MAESEFEREQEQAAAAEAAGIGGKVSYDRIGEGDDGEPVDPAQAPLIEAGEGESEGFELAEQALEENASHGDGHASWRINQDASRQNEDSRATEAGEGDSEQTSERPGA